MQTMITGYLKAGRMAEALADRTDDALLRRYARGDVAAFDVLYDRYSGAVYRYLYRSCQNEALASEMFQDVWTRVVSAAARFRDRGRFRAWLFSLAHNRLVDHYRHQERQPEFTDADRVTGRGGPLAEASGDEQWAHLQAALRELPEEQRQAFYLREECGLSIREIAHVQGIRTEAAKSRVRYAYQRLREAMEKPS